IVPASAMVRAVIVGASDFSDPKLAAFSLPGAARDAERMATALTRLDVTPGSMTVLTGKAATLAAVRTALDGLASASQAGDRAVIFLSGHGTQAPARAGDPIEPDGVDELFLTADTRGWDSRSRTLPGALADDEIGRRVGELRARGVDVWVVIDSCTGGGLMRGGGRQTAKMLPAARLAIPSPAPARGAIDASGFIDGGLAGGGRLVAFAAAGPGAIAWDDGDGGAFTNALTAAIAAQIPSSYSILAAQTDRGGAGAIWTSGDLSAPLLFTGRSPDLVEMARQLPPLPFGTSLSIDGEGACLRDGRVSAAPIDPGHDAVTVLRHCDHVRVDMAEPAEALRVEAWYRDAAGGYTSLAPPLGLIVAPGRWANVGFTFVTRDPATGRVLPQGEEMLVLIARDAQGQPRGAKLLRFRARA
ncbi:MAG: caspase family protein, partial [Rhizorhabdus sp.]